MKGKQQFTDKISASILQNTWKVRALSVCCFRTHVCQSLAVARVRIETFVHLSSYVRTCQATDVDGWCLENWFPSAHMHHHSPVLGPDLSYVMYSPLLANYSDQWQLMGLGDGGSGAGIIL